MRATLGLFLLIGVLPAQETRGVLYGRILDPHRSAISGAGVQVTNRDTNTTVAVTSNDTGYYEASLLLPGNYRLTVDANGFRKLVRDGIVLTVSARLEVDLELQIGSLAETVSVTAEAPILDTNSVTSGTFTVVWNASGIFTLAA